MSQTFALVTVALAVTLSASAQMGNTKAMEAIRRADREWMAAYASKSVDKAASFVAPDGAIYEPNAPAAQGQEAVKKMAAEMFKLPEVKLSWTPTLVEAAKSGDLGFSSGTYEFSFKDPSGKTIDDKGKYVTVWKKQADGSWKVLRDIFNSDLPSQSTQ
jgi:ketosteroid isomerase-like protein